MFEASVRYIKAGQSGSDTLGSWCVCSCEEGGGGGGSGGGGGGGAASALGIGRAIGDIAKAPLTFVILVHLRGSAVTVTQ